MSLVSVVIPTRDRPDLVRQAIESVLAVERTGFEIEILVIDDGSDTDVDAALRSHPIRYFRTAGLGAAAARNVGIKEAHGDFLAFLDDDDVWLPNNVRPQLRLLELFPEYGAAHAQARLAGADGMPYGDPMPMGPLRGGWVFEDLLETWPQIGTLVVRASVARKIGKLDPKLQSEEEWDWMLRIAKHCPVGRIEEPVMLFRQRGLPSDALAWRRLPDTLRVFRRHTRDNKGGRRLRIQRILWAHRGWYTAIFLANAHYYRRIHNLQGVARCLGYAFATSPVHAALGLARRFIARGVR